MLLSNLFNKNFLIKKKNIGLDLWEGLTSKPSGGGDEKSELLYFLGPLTLCSASTRPLVQTRSGTFKQHWALVIAKEALLTTVFALGGPWPIELTECIYKDCFLVQTSQPTASLKWIRRNPPKKCLEGRKTPIMSTLDYLTSPGHMHLFWSDSGTHTGRGQLASPIWAVVASYVETGWGVCQSLWQ